jgi:tetratricopeptide (TPR) repeat protein
MITRAARAVILMSASLLLFACGEKLQLDVKARLNDGQPAAQATVTVDTKVIGTTDANGVFTKVIRKKPGADVEVVVSKEQTGYRIQPWKGSFMMKLPKGAMDTYSFEAVLTASRYVTIAATESGTPVDGATVKASGKEVGTTDAKGEFIYEYTALPEKGADLVLTKSGFSTWSHKGPLEPGQRLEAKLSKRAMVSISALTEEYGQASAVGGVTVSIDKKPVGKTDAKGAFTYSYDGEPGKKVQLGLSAPGYTPSNWKTAVTLEGEVAIQRYFYPTTAKPIRAGIYRFVSNSPGVDIKDLLAKTEDALEVQLFKYSCFRKVPSDTLQASLKAAKVSIDKAVTKGWRETSLRRTVDMIVLGSVAKNDQGLLIETKFYTSGGKLILSHIARARGAGDINSAAKEIAAAVVERFPFEGTVTAVDGDRYKINIGKGGYRIGRGMEFNLTAARLDESGKVAGYREIGRLVVKKTEDAASWTEIEDIRKGEKVSIGDRVVRRIVREDEEASKNFVVLSAKGGVPPDVSPLSGANIYMNEEWIGATNAEGVAEVPVKLGKKYDLVLYRHGYQQAVDKIRVEKSGERKEYVLQVNNSIFKLESEPSGAEVMVDGDKIGKTPIHEAKVTLGFHTVKVSVGGDFRDWEEVVEFASKVEDRTGSRKIVLQKDFLKIGERAEQQGNIDAAIQAYASTEKGHPDYSEAHHRLAQLYLDEKEDYDAAIREFESVLSLPENQQLIYKQYAVAFTNLGHAYYEKGSALVQKDKDAAAQDFAKAIQNLQTAKQNTRFFPNLKYDEAVHDTYYYLALSYHKLYLITKKGPILNSANLAWREYFDFFPKKLEGNSTYDQSRESAQKYWDQIKEQM